MKNPDYHPDTAHLPSARDKELWRLGGWKKEKAARENLAKVRAKWDAAEKNRAEMLASLETQP
jgi:hypothetical protein